jgi:hypothetical protein
MVGPTYLKASNTPKQISSRAIGIHCKPCIDSIMRDHSNEYYACVGKAKLNKLDENDDYTAHRYECGKTLLTER